MQKPNKSERGWVRAFIALGSNEGDRLGYVQQAMQLLKDHSDIEVVECSSLYETEPVGRRAREWFVNAVASVETKLSPKELMEVCQDIERRLTNMAAVERTEVVRESGKALNQRRIIHLDILFYGDSEVSTSYMQVPHPYVDRRAYALVPMLEIAPDMTHPTLGKTMIELHDSLLAPEQVYLYGTREICESF